MPNSSKPTNLDEVRRRWDALKSATGAEGSCCMGRNETVILIAAGVAVGILGLGFWLGRRSAITSPTPAPAEAERAEDVESGARLAATSPTTGEAGAATGTTAARRLLEPLLEKAITGALRKGTRQLKSAAEGEEEAREG